MRNCIIYLCGIIFLALFGPNSFGQAWGEIPLKYISGYELDLNNDGRLDIALLVETTKGRELVVLMEMGNRYNAFVVWRGKANMYLSCHFGKYVKETLAGKGRKKKARVFKTPGVYIELAYPEGPSVAYFWDGKGFKEVWTSD